MKVVMYVLALLFAVLCLGGLIQVFQKRFDWLDLIVAIALGAAAVGFFRAAEKRR